MRILAGVLVLVMFGVLASGCEQHDAGAPPPKTEPLTQEKLNEMPPEARDSIQRAMQQGQQTGEQIGKNKTAGGS